MWTPATAWRKLFHSEITIPVHPGPLTLVYPRWGIPTYEFPAGVLNNIVRLKMSGNGEKLQWKRDLVNWVGADISA